MKALLKGILRRDLHAKLALIAFCSGIGWIVLSRLVGVATLPVDGRDVGYVFALNWSVVYTFLLPIILFSCLKICLQARTTIETMASKGMILYDGKIIKNKKGILNKFDSYILFGLKLWIVVSISLFIYSAWEWSTDSFLPLFGGTTNEIDWMVGALVNEEVRVWQNATFTALVFVFAQWPLMAVGFLFLIYSLAYCLFLHELLSSESRHAVIPDVTCDDDRLGSECFEEFGRSLITFAIPVMATLYLTVLVNQYVNQAQPGCTSIIDFAIRHGKPYDMITPDVSTQTALLGALFLFFATSIALFTPSLLARSAFERLRNLIDNEIVSLYGDEMRETVVQVRESSVKYWPYSFISRKTYLLFVIFSMGGMIFYRLYPIIFAIEFVHLVKVWWKKIREGLKPS